MAHNLNFRNGKASFASTEVAWHKLGTKVESAMTSEEAIRLAQLDYDVLQMPNVHRFPNGNEIISEESFFTYRNDTQEVLGKHVGKRYEIVQNRDAFTFYDAIVGQNKAVFVSAGVLGKGERIFVTAKMPDYIRIAGTDDLIENFVVLTSSHDGTGAVIAAISPVRIVCANTLKISLSQAINKVSVRHTTNAEANLAQAHKLLNISNDYITKASEAFNFLATKKMTDEQMKNLVTELFPSGREDKDSTRIINIREAVMTSYFSGIGQAEIMGSAWAGLNGLTHYFSNGKDYKDAESKFDNLVMEGASSKVTDKAMELLMAM